MKKRIITDIPLVKNKNKYQITLLLILILIIGGFLILSFCRAHYENIQLKENGIIGYAIIKETYIGTKARDFIRYEFYVNDQLFNGHERFYPQFEPYDISDGDTLEIIYSISNPDINRAMTHENKTLKIKKK